MILRNAFYKDLPNEQSIYDYGLRTDGQPVYSGFSKLGTSQANDKWILFFTKYNAGGMVTEEYRLEGSWSNRVTLFLPYV